MYKSIILIAFTLWNTLGATNGEDYNFVKVIDSGSVYVVKQKGHRSAMPKVVESTLNQFRQKGYLLAVCDTVYLSTDSLIVKIDKHIKFEDLVLRLDQSFCVFYPNLCREILQVTNSLGPQTIAKVHNVIESYFENQGFPFASFEYDSVLIAAGSISAKLKIEPSQKFYFDTLVLPSATRSKNTYLQALLSIRKGTPYSRKKIMDINRAISQSGFLELVSEPYVSFRFDKAYVHLEVREKNLTRVNGFVGLVPDKRPTKNTVAGEVDLGFRNLFGYGIDCKLDWKRFQSLSQNANIQVVVPYLLKSSIGFSGSLEILKQDSSFVNIHRKLEFGYKLNPLFGMFLGYQNYSSAVNNRLQEYGDRLLASKTQQYGIGCYRNTINDNFFPTMGMAIEGNVYAGQKHLNAELADSLPKVSTQFNMSFKFDRVIRLGKKSVLFFKSSSKVLANSHNAIYENDLFRLGGINNLRGFGENAFYASAFAFGALEYRILTSKDAYGVIFMNMAALQNQYAKPLEYPFGGGLGYVFKTQIGVLQVFYSLGKSRVDAITLENSKVHIALRSGF